MSQFSFSCKEGYLLYNSYVLTSIICFVKISHDKVNLQRTPKLSKEGVILHCVLLYLIHFVKFIVLHLYNKVEVFQFEKRF